MHTLRERSVKLQWSVVIPAHNCAHFLTETLREVVAQLGDRKDAEIVVVDDASSDEPDAVVRRLGNGRVRYVRNATQLGAIGTFNRCVSLARGEIVHILHGDDVVLPGFYRAMEQAMDGSPALAAVCRTLDIDGEGLPLYETRRYRRGTGIWNDAFEAFAVSNRVRAPSIVVRRAAYEKYGLFRTDLPHAADWEMWTRMAGAGPVLFVDETLAGYRRHAASDTARVMATGSNIRERVTALGLISERFPVTRRSALVRKGLLYSVAYAGRTSVKSVQRGQWRIAAVQAREAARCLMMVPGGLRQHGCSSRGVAESAPEPLSVIRSVAGVDTEV